MLMILELFIHSTGDLVKKSVVLHTKLSMFNKFLVHARSWYGGLNKEHFVFVGWV